MEEQLFLQRDAAADQQHPPGSVPAAFKKEGEQQIGKEEQAPPQKAPAGVVLFRMLAVCLVCGVMAARKNRKVRALGIAQVVLSVLLPVSSFVYDLAGTGSAPGGPGELGYLSGQMAAGDSAAWLLAAGWTILLLLFLLSLWVLTAGRKAGGRAEAARQI